MADEMDVDGVRGACAQQVEFRSFGGKLLHAVFAEEREAQRGCFGNRRRRIGLRDGHQLNFGAGAPGAAAGGCYRLFQPFEIIGKRRHCAPVRKQHRTATQLPPPAYNRSMWTIVLLIFSNIFMTFAWYGHLKFRQEALWKRSEEHTSELQ